MENKIYYYILILIIMVLGILIGFNKHDIKVGEIDINTINGNKVVSEFTNLALIKRYELKDFVNEVTGFNSDVSEYLIEQCNKKDLDIFLVLGLMRLESNFNNKLVGTSGEIGLGQVMDITGKAVAKNLGIPYSKDKLFEPKYNILVFTTHLKYLFKYYDNDLHKVLTAYNRGQNGLNRYIASRSSLRNPEVSAYSRKVIEYYNHYKIKYKKQKNIIN